MLMQRRIASPASVVSVHAVHDSRSLSAEMGYNCHSCVYCMQLSGSVVSIVSRDGMSRAPVVRFERALRAHEAKLWLEEEEHYQLVMDAFNSTSRS